MALFDELLARPVAARAMQVVAGMGLRLNERRRRALFPEYPGCVERLTIPTSVAPAPVTVYRPEAPATTSPAVHVNFHGGGYILGTAEQDDPLCRFLAARAGVVVVNVEYVLAPQHRFPAAPQQAWEVARWVAEHGAENGWDGTLLSVGGQSAGGGLAAAVARQSLESGSPPIRLQVLHYPPLDLVTPAREKPAAIPHPVITGWMGVMFDNAYIPDPADRSDRLASPAHPCDTADLTGIAPALVITCEYDRLRGDGERYARRLRAAGSLVELYDVPSADHGYDAIRIDLARTTYELIADHLRRPAL